MTELETLIKLLAFQLGDNLRLRDALIETMLTVMAEEEPVEGKLTSQLSHLELLTQIQQRQIQSEKTGAQETHSALEELSNQLREELQQAALILHQSLRSGQFELDSELIRRVGLDVKDFPVGFPQDIDLLDVSKRYLQTLRDLHFLQNHFPDSLPGMREKLARERLQTARWLQEVALEALSAGNFSDLELVKFHRKCLDTIQHQRITVENELLTFISGKTAFHFPDAVPKMEVWLQKYGGLARNILKSLSSPHKKILLELLIRTRDYTGLEALIEVEFNKKEEQDLFYTLMTLRFGEEFHDAAHSWKAWLSKRIDQAIQKTQAVVFWQAHPYYIPSLLSEHVLFLPLQKEEFALGESLSEDIREMNAVEFLERRRPDMTAHEIQALEGILPAQPPVPISSAEPTFHFDEVLIEEELQRSLPEKKSDSPLSTVMEGAVETVVDAAIEGNLTESTIITVIDKGSELFDEQLTIRIEEEEEESQAEPKVKPAPIPEEPQENIWRDHFFPFIRANLVFVLAPSLIFVGLLLLVFTLWDKAVWIRYGLTPFLLVSVSYALSRIGLWLKGEDIQSDSPIALMQSVAVFLAPMSLLFVALLAVDSELQLPVRIIWGIALSAALLAAWWYIFILSVKTVYREMANTHSYTLLLLNALLLLLPVAQLMMSSGMNIEAKMILVFGFYVGFLILSWSMRRVLGKMMQKVDASGRVPTIFYSVTCLGTFGLVWGLTHARLMILPQPFTYAPLLLLFSFLISMVEFTLLDIREQKGRISSLSYSAYFFIGLGVLLSIGHDYVRVITLLLAGLIWFYQALKLHDERHFNLSMVILTLAFSMIALVRDFPAPFFPYLTLIVIAILYFISLRVPYREVAILAARLTPVYMSFVFVVSILWQWAEELNPLGYGFAFVMFGLFSIYLGAKTDKLIHVHAGAGYIVAALPYLGSVDMNLYTLEGNTLVFGLAMVGVFWTMMSSASRNSAIRDSRSTVLWNIGILAFCLMCLRVILGEALDFSANPFLQVQILSGPVLIAALLLLTGYFTRSYVPVYLALVVLVIIFPEIKDRFEIPMYSGLGSTFSGIGFLVLVFILSLWQFLRDEKKRLDLIWRKRKFPFQAKNHYLLYANPLVVAAFFLFTRTIFVTYPTNYFKPLMPFSIKTCIAVLLSGTAYHVLSLWFRKSWFSYIGFIAIGFGIVHSCYLNTGDYFYDVFLPVFLLITLLYCQMLWVFSAKYLSPKKAIFIFKPFKYLQTLFLWIAALGLYGFYSFYYARFYQTTYALYWAPLVAYLCGLAIWLGWRSAKRSWLFFIPAYLLLWQFVTLGVTKGNYLPESLRPDSPFLLATSLMVLGIVSLFFLFEHIVSKEKFRSLSPLLWVSFVLLLLFSPIFVFIFYLIPIGFPHLTVLLIIWALVSLILGRFLNLGPLWLWSVFLIHLLFLPSTGGRTRFYVSFHPFTLACIALFLAGLSILTAKVKWLYEYNYAWPRAKYKMLSPSSLFAVVSHLVVILVFWLATIPEYRHEWLTILGLFLASLPALFAAHQLGFSRHFLFGVPYTLAWIALMLAVRSHFPENQWLMHLQILLLIGLGLFGALLTAVMNDYVLPCKDQAYTVLKYIAGAGVIVLIIVTYLSIRNLDLISWQWFATSGILSLGTGLYFRYMQEYPTQSHEDAKKRFF